MIKKIITLFIFMFGISPLFAHYIWLETASTGKLNKEHTVRVYFGEYTYGKIEKVDDEAFQNVKDFTIWVVSPNGTKQKLKPVAKTDFYEATFVPTQDGTYTITLDNKNMDVLDYTKYDYAIFKPQYHAKTKVVVGEVVNETKPTNPNSIEIIDVSKSLVTQNSEVILKVLYKGSPLMDNEVSIFIQDLWSKKLTTNEKGEVSFKLPFKTTYTIETTFEEKTPGKFKGKDYALTWHCATYCIKLHH
ncbi:MAG: ferredoxin [Maribacter sp.]|nr:MAG: ferredoxin [Maribacter sp.]